MHRSLATYIAGTMLDKDLNIDDAIWDVYVEFEDDAKAKSENQDMLKDFHPRAVSYDDRIEIYQCLRAMKLLQARLAAV